MEAETPNYPKEIKAKMTKEKQLSEKVKRNIYGEDVNFTKDVAYDLKRVKELIKEHYWNRSITWILKEIDEITGSFDNKNNGGKTK